MVLKREDKLIIFLREVIFTLSLRFSSARMHIIWSWKVSIWAEERFQQFKPNKTNEKTYLKCIFISMSIDILADFSSSKGPSMFCDQDMQKQYHTLWLICKIKIIQIHSFRSQIIQILILVVVSKNWCAVCIFYCTAEMYILFKWHKISNFLLWELSFISVVLIKFKLCNKETMSFWNSFITFNIFFFNIVLQKKTLKWHESW